MRASVPALIFLFATSVACTSKAPLTAEQISERKHNEAWLESSGHEVTHELPDGWELGTARQFAQNLADWELPTPLLWSQAAHTQLSEALLSPSTTAAAAQLAVRAALLLAKDSSDRSHTSLLIRLERRQAPAERGRQGVEVVCANVLAEQDSIPESSLRSLHKLATGLSPHPDLDVRVECARAYLAHIPQASEGQTPLRARECLRFLIKVLRSETPAQNADPIVWDRVRTVAWPKGRAAEEVTRWFPTEVPFRADGPWQDQVDWAQAAFVGLGL
ncbi:MAG: hypothetical protein P1V35_16325 [Planctomycetota bacterium]|nr:hypothetical protein [Planctomycetota bacterium]